MDDAWIFNFDRNFSISSCLTPLRSSPWNFLRVNVSDNHNKVDEGSPLTHLFAPPSSIRHVIYRHVKRERTQPLRALHFRRLRERSVVETASWCYPTYHFELLESATAVDGVARGRCGSCFFSDCFIGSYSRFILCSNFLLSSWRKGIRLPMHCNARLHPLVLHRWGGRYSIGDTNSSNIRIYPPQRLCQTYLLKTLLFTVVSLRMVFYLLAAWISFISALCIINKLLFSNCTVPTHSLSLHYITGTLSSVQIIFCMCMYVFLYFGLLGILRWGGRYRFLMHVG